MCHYDADQDRLPPNQHYFENPHESNVDPMPGPERAQDCRPGSKHLSTVNLKSGANIHVRAACNTLTFKSNTKGKNVPGKRKMESHASANEKALRTLETIR